jgi:hypothetical protein
MSLGVGLFLIAVGAILAFAVQDSTIGNVDVSVVGVILMIIGLAGSAISMMVWSRYSPSRRRTSLIERDLPGGRVIEREIPPGRIIERESPPTRVVHVENTPNGTERIIEEDVPPPPSAQMTRHGDPRRSRW